MDYMVNFLALFFFSVTILVMVSRGKRIYALTALLSIPVAIYVAEFDGYLASIVPFVMELIVHLVVNVVRHELNHDNAKTRV